MEHHGGTDGARKTALHDDAAQPGRLAAHERLSTGTLARWTRAFATHPWRVIAAWLGIVAGLVVLVGTVGGDLRDEFDIPGSDTQRATDLIESEFASEQGSVLNVVFAAPEGERLDTPARQAAIEQALARLMSSEFEPTDDRAGLVSVGDPFSRADFLRGRADRLRRSTVRSGDRAGGSRRGGRRAGCGPRDGRAGRRDGGVQRRGRVPAGGAGDPGGAGPARGDSGAHRSCSARSSRC